MGSKYSFWMFYHGPNEIHFSSFRTLERKVKFKKMKVWNSICTYQNCSFEEFHLLSPHKCPCVVLVVHAMVLSVTDLSSLNSHYYLYTMSGFPHSKFWYPSMHLFFHLGFDPVICKRLLKNHYRLSTYKLNFSIV